MRFLGTIRQRRKRLVPLRKIEIEASLQTCTANFWKTNWKEDWATCENRECESKALCKLDQTIPSGRYLDMDRRGISPLAGTISVLKSSSLLLMLLLILSCSRSKDKWFLRSYDNDKGYTFMRNGVEYQTKCFAFGWTDTTTPNFAWDHNIANNPVEATHEDSCVDILPYLSKSRSKLKAKWRDSVL